jgi:protoheme IX farnesyltransferase
MFMKDYLKLTSPGITFLVILTGFIGMWTASRGTVQPDPFLFGLIGLGLATAGSSVFNNYYDRDIDRLMIRTSNRPLPSGRIKPWKALVFGIFLSLTGFLILIFRVNSLTAFLTVLALFFYSYLYTVVLKRKTPLATEIGGMSGALPPLIGWTAIKGGISLEPFSLFAIMLLWQPPHFWSLAQKHRDDYMRARIPTISVRSSERETNIRSLLYITGLIAASLLPYFTGLAGSLYLGITVISGTLYLTLYIYALVSGRDINRYLFFYSIAYLTLIFSFIALDIQ